MNKHVQNLPLIKRPINEIVRIAHEAGRTAAANAELIQSASLGMRFEWIGQHFPGGFGISDDQFDKIVSQACEAFDEGLSEYCDSLAPPEPAAKHFSPEYRAGVALALKKLGEWEGSEQLPKEISSALQAGFSDGNIEQRTGFSETIAAFLMNSMDLGPPILARWPVFEDLALLPGTRHE